jgi:ABC-2 type transport system ATP-binding protein
MEYAEKLNSSIIGLDKITKTFGNHIAVNNLSLTVPKGSIYGFIGPNGSGKTTTIRMIMNILYPDNGSILLFGQKQSGSRFDDVGYLPEERGLYKKMKVKSLIRFYAELKNVSDPAKIADEWLEKFELTNWANKKVESLSKGMSQKVQFIIAVINKPSLIILDEPFSGLDPVNAEIIKEEILGLRNNGSTIIFSTHDMSVAEKMCDFIFMIYKGEKVLDGTLKSIKNQFGMDTIRIKHDGDKEILKEIKNIDKINDFGQEQELKMHPESDAQTILSEIISKTKVTKFEITSPSLNDIFIRIAKPEKI